MDFQIKKTATDQKRRPISTVISSTKRCAEVVSDHRCSWRSRPYCCHHPNGARCHPVGQGWADGWGDMLLLMILDVRVGGDWNMAFMTFHILGISWSQLTQLTNIFQKGRYTTKQIYIFRWQFRGESWWVIFLAWHFHFGCMEFSREKTTGSVIGILSLKGARHLFFVSRRDKARYRKG